MIENLTEKHFRTIKSFVLRQGKITKGQQRAIENGSEKFCLDIAQLADLKNVFHNDKPLTIEIGFGMGTSLYNLAKEDEKHNFIGFEVHKPGVGNLLSLLLENEIDNLKIINFDAVEAITKFLPDNSIERILILFPDPWHKKKHNKRRIIQNEFVLLLYKKLKQDGILHIATDWEPYAEHMLEIFAENQQFKNVAGINNFIERPDWRYKTKFELRGENLGHKVFDLQFKK